jgi:hypothetical protein
VTIERRDAWFGWFLILDGDVLVAVPNIRLPIRIGALDRVVSSRLLSTLGCVPRVR